MEIQFSYKLKFPYYGYGEEVEIDIVLRTKDFRCLGI
jgi:hypothetical protein